MNIKSLIHCILLVVTLILCAVTAEASRFVDNGNGTLTDKETGLMWQKNNVVDYQQWTQAKSYCEDLQLGGHSDWRLPDKDELSGIFDKVYYGQSGIAIDPAFELVSHHTSNHNYYAYWTNTEYPDSTFQPLKLKYIVIFGMFREDFLGVSDDIASNDHKNEVLCVRSGPSGINNIDTQIPGTIENILPPLTIRPDNQKPTAAFTVTKTSGQVPVTVMLNALSSFDPDGPISSYNWSSSDNQTATGQTATFTFEKGGNITLTLTVTDNDGATAEARQLVTADIPNLEPTASFLASPTTGPASLKVVLDASGSLDPDGSISDYRWLSSDGKIATGQKTSMTFDSAGTYTISLLVRDDRGATGAYEKTINVLYDTTPASIDIIFPLSEVKLTGAVHIVAEVKDESIIRSVRVFVDGNVFGNMQKSASGAWEFDLRTESLSNGPHRLVVKATSNIGLIGEDSIKFNSDNEDLLATITTPRDKDTLEGTIDVVMFVSEESRLSSAVLYLDDKPFGGRLTSGPWEFRLPTARLDNGYHTLAVKLITHDGQIEWTQVLSIESLNEYDESEIDVSMNLPEDGKALGPCFTVEVDAITEEHVESVALYLDDNTLLETQENTPHQNNFAFNVDLNDYDNGEHTLSVYLKTGTGSTGFAGPVSFILDTKYANVQQRESPEIYSFNTDVNTGKSPLQVAFTCEAGDLSGGMSEYIWDFGDDSGDRTTSSMTTTHTYHNAGIYRATCTVVNNDKLKTVSNSLRITVENDDVVDNINSDYPDETYCATIGGSNGTLHIPCVDVGHVDSAQKYEMNLSVVPNTGLVFELDDFSQVVLPDNDQCAILDAFQGRLHIPCVDDGVLYWADLKLVPADSMRFEIQDFDLLKQYVSLQPR